MALFIVSTQNVKRSLAELGVDCGGEGDGDENGLLYRAALAAPLRKVQRAKNIEISAKCSSFHAFGGRNPSKFSCPIRDDVFRHHPVRECLQRTEQQRPLTSKSQHVLEASAPVQEMKLLHGMPSGLSVEVVAPKVVTRQVYRARRVSSRPSSPHFEVTSISSDLK